MKHFSMIMKTIPISYGNLPKQTGTIKHHKMPFAANCFTIKELAQDLIFWPAEHLIE